MTERFGEIERRLDALEKRIRRMEERLPAETAAAFPESEAVPHPAAETSTFASGSLLALLGRTVLALGGGFLIRALTESGALSTGLGVALGLAYGAGWLLLALRGAAAAGLFDGLSGIGIAFPLIWEATTRLKVFGPRASIGAAAAVSAIALAAAARQAGPALAWVATAASALLFAALAPAAGRIDLAAAALVALAAATGALAYARRWPGPRWIAAIAADLAVPSLAAVVAREGGLPGAYRGTSPAIALAVALLLPLSTLALVGVRTVSRRRSATVFEFLQSATALAAGFGGALAIARSGVGGEPVIAAAALASSAAFYVVAFRFFSPARGLDANFHLSASLGLLMAVFGGAVALRPFPRAILWGAAASALAAALGRPRRETAAGHCAVYLMAAAFCGLFGAIVAAFLRVPEGAGLEFRAAAWAGLASAAFVAGLAFAGPARADPARRAVRLLAAAVAAGGTGAAVVSLLAGLTLSGAASRGLSTVRMAVLAGSVVLLAALARGRARDLRYLVYAAIGIGAVKLVVDDLPNGTPAGRFAAFVLYGGALLIAPSLLRAADRPKKSLQPE
ncbi:MAG TPA: hypothetical protein VFS34_05390 [Thermoanaerobaculia bacterium]|nr:hypothetical protein [Thermoanaerobaculia bacterium]